MKIAIISINMYTKGLNFACPLHTYAMQEFLRQHGADVTVLNYQPNYYNNFDQKHPYDYYVPICEKIARRMETETGPALEKDKELLNTLKKKRDGYRKVYRDREIRCDKFWNFINTRYHKTETVYNSDLLELEDPGFDCYICATDVIWGYTDEAGFDRGFFLASKAMENKWKIAYAASCGPHMPKTEKQTARFFSYLSDIDYISVREASLKDYIEQNSGLKAHEALDPVMLHDRDFYESFAVKPPEAESGYLFLYYVKERGTDTIQNAICYAKAHDLLIVEMSDQPLKNGRVKDSDGVRHVSHYAVGVEEWLGYILYADAVFTNSFHSTCFSILFEKDLFVGQRNSNKIDNVIRIFELENRRVNAQSDLIGNPPAPIDYGHVRGILEQKRKESADFLLNALKEIEGKKRPPRDYDSQKRALTCRVVYKLEVQSDRRMVNAGGVSLADGCFQVNGHTANGWNLCVKIENSPVVYKIESWPDKKMVNNGKTPLAFDCFQINGHAVTGWNLLVKIEKFWFWYMEDGTLVQDGKTENRARKIFRCGEVIPYLPVGQLASIAAVAVPDSPVLDGESAGKPKAAGADGGSPLWMRVRNCIQGIFRKGNE